MKLTDQDIKALAQLERDMDKGIQPFVVNHGSRWAFSGEIMARFGLETGQTVSEDILRAILQANIDATQVLIDAQQWPSEV